EVDPEQTGTETPQSQTGKAVWDERQEHRSTDGYLSITEHFAEERRIHIREHWHTLRSLVAQVCNGVIIHFQFAKPRVENVCPRYGTESEFGEWVEFHMGL